MLDLAMNETGEYITIKSIADRQGISDKYLEQIVTILSRAGFVNSVRGAQGGYKLASPAESYTVGMILRQIEGSLAPVACIQDKAAECPRRSKCVTIDVWKRIDDAVNSVVDSITLADLVNNQREKYADANEYMI